MDQLSSACLLSEPKNAYTVLKKLIQLTISLYQRMRGPSLLKEQLVIQIKRLVLKVRHVLTSLDTSSLGHL